VRRQKKCLFLVILFLIWAGRGTVAEANPYDVGVFYFPGWGSNTKYWNDLKGLPGSRSPNTPWPDREPLLGYYPEEEQWVADKHLEWAYSYGIAFFTYDWYWDGKSTFHAHAIGNYLKSPWKDKVKFSILWVNRSEPQSKKEFEDMVDYWINNYISEPSYYRIDDKPVVFVYSNGRLDGNARKLGLDARALLLWASERCKEKTGKGIYFVSTTNERPSQTLERSLKNYGYAAYTGWNYVVSRDKSNVADYDSMVETYLGFYEDAARTGSILPYIVPSSPGYDTRPWARDREVFVRKNPTPEKFARMLHGAKRLMDTREAVPSILMIEAWNEFAEGSYIEPTRKWGTKYLETIKEIFGPGNSRP